VPAINQNLRIDGPAGKYTFAAQLEKGGAPRGGRLTILMSDRASLPRLTGGVTTWGIDEDAKRLLTSQGASPTDFGVASNKTILVGTPEETGNERVKRLHDVLTSVTKEGATAVFLDPEIFSEGDDAVRWLPLDVKGTCYHFDDWLYHKECVAKHHLVFEGLQAPGIMDWDYYGPLIPHKVFSGQQDPQETIAGWFALGHNEVVGGYAGGTIVSTYGIGRARKLRPQHDPCSEPDRPTPRSRSPAAQLRTLRKLASLSNR
jgi:hypothetical protein